MTVCVGCVHSGRGHGYRDGRTRLSSQLYWEGYKGTLIRSGMD